MPDSLTTGWRTYFPLLPAFFTVMSKTKSTASPFPTVNSVLSWSFSLGSLTFTRSPFSKVAFISET